MITDPHQDERHPVEVLADDFSIRLRNGEHPSIDEYEQRYPQFAELIRSVFPSIELVERVAIREDEDRKSNSKPTLVSNSASVPESLGDYQIIREIGRGGMGIVYEAVQQSLNRHVALKVVNALVSGNSQHRARFRREAESAASLHHTNIVPIYGIGEDHGLQYYAMQLIDGVTLEDVIECLREDASETRPPPTNPLPTKLNFHTSGAAQLFLRSSWTSPVFGRESESSDSFSESTARKRIISEAETVPLSELNGTPDPLSNEGIDEDLSQRQVTPRKRGPFLKREYFRNVARTIANVANGLDYAHRQHVLHRDIKPSNLLIDREGTIWITDFGLARRTDLDAATQAGEILGTLRYMAPEQIAGHGDSRVDIYSLGLTLYEMLTLRSAIESPKLRLLDPERNSVIPSPRSINPDIPLDLQTITVKACAYSPQHRYQSASEFEGDLRRFLEDRPILARQTSRLEKLARWARRNPAIATLSSLAVVMLVVIASLLAIWNRQQHRSIVEIGKQFDRAELNLKERSAALETVKKEQSRAEMNLELAIKAFDKITDNIASRGNTFSGSIDLVEGEDYELSGASLSQADVLLLETLLEFFDEFSQKNDKDLRSETATALQRVADIQHKIGKLDDAEKTYRKALESFRALHKQFPDQKDALLSQVSICNELIVLSAKRGQNPRTFGLYKDARTLLEQSPEIAASAEGRFALAKLLNSVGTLTSKFARDPRMRQGGPMARLGVVGEAISAKLRQDSEFNAEALSLLKTLVAESPENIPYKLVLARALKDETRIAKLSNDLPRADDAMMRSVEILEVLCKSHPESSAFKFELADTLGTSIGMRPVDMQHANRSLAICEQILQESPSVPEYLALKASSLVKIGSITQFKGGSNQKAEEFFIEAVQIQKGLVNRYPDVALYTVSLGLYLRQLGDVQLSMKKPEKAKEYFNQAIQLAETLQHQRKGMAWGKQFVEQLLEKKSRIETPGR